jgi:hypothetical protein
VAQDQTEIAGDQAGKGEGAGLRLRIARELHWPAHVPDYRDVVDLSGRQANKERAKA